MTIDAVFDYFPRGTPFLTNEAIDDVIDELLDANAPPDDIVEAVRYEEVRQLQTNDEYRSRLETAYRESGVNLVSPTMGRASLNNPVTYGEKAFQELAMWQGRIDALEWLHKATSPAEARRIVDQGGVGVVPNLQNIGTHVYDDIGELDDLYNAGVRIMQLTYNAQNLLGSAALDRVDGGLSDHGVDVVGRLNDMGVVIDLSHCGERTTLDAIRVSDSPVAFTHTMCQSIADLERGQSDEELRAVADVDGYVGFLALPTFIAPGRTDEVIDVFFEHLDHAASIVGIDSVGVGTDWGRWTTEVPERLRDGIERSYEAAGFKGDHFLGTGMSFGPMRKYADRHDVLASELDDRGYSDAEKRGILGENFVSFWERVTG